MFAQPDGCDPFAGVVWAGGVASGGSGMEFWLGSPSFVHVGLQPQAMMPTASMASLVTVRETGMVDPPFIRMTHPDPAPRGVG
jgi:hypothetical protein